MSDFAVKLEPKYLMTDCDPSKTMNKIAAIHRKGIQSKNPDDDRPVAYVGFACDAEYNTFADLSAHKDWRVPIVGWFQTVSLKFFCVPTSKKECLNLASNWNENQYRTPKESARYNRCVCSLTKKKIC